MGLEKAVDWEGKIEQTALEGTAGEYMPLDIVQVQDKETEQLWDYMVRTWHYLGYQKMIGPRIKYIIFYHGQPIAAISFIQAALKIGVRDRLISVVQQDIQRTLPYILNNNRFLILPWVKVKNLASHILSMILPVVQKDWQLKYNRRPLAVETFVDISKYKGTCYKAANWAYLGETKGFEKSGKTFVYHGNKKGVFFRVISRKFYRITASYPKCKRRSNPKKERVRENDMMLSIPDWSPDLFSEIGLNEQSVAGIAGQFTEYMDRYASCYTRKDQQENGETYIKGLLSDLDRKSVEPIALRYRDEKAVRTMQLHLKDSPWDDQQMRKIYQRSVFEMADDPEGMMTVDGSDFAKKGNFSAGVARQYCDTKGKVDNCQAGVFIGYSGSNGYGLLGAGLYLPQKWFDEEHMALWEQCDIPEQTIFRTKPQIAIDLIQSAIRENTFHYQWVGCDAGFGFDAQFRKALPPDIYFFTDIHCNQRVFMHRPEWILPERKSGRGKAPVKLVPSEAAVTVSDVARDDSLPWETVNLGEGAKGPLLAQVKCLRVIECVNGKDGDELWLYIRKLESGEIKYSFSNAPADIPISKLNHAALLRWPIEQSFQECKSFLGMDQYETRSYVGWYRHMLLVMVAHLFVMKVRFYFKKKLVPC